MVKNFKISLYNILFFALGLAMLYGGVNYVISPYFYALLFALFGVNIGLFKFIFGFVAAGLVFEFSASMFVYLLCSIVILLFMHYLGKTKKVFKQRWFIMLGLLLSNIPYFIFRAVSPLTLVLCFVNLILEIAFFYAYSQLFIGIHRRGFQTRLAVDEFIGLVILLLPLSITLYKINIFGVNLGFIIFALFIMLAGFVVGALESLSLAVIFGLSVLMCGGGVAFFGVTCLWALGATSVKPIGRPLMALVMLIIDVILGVYFNVYIDYGIFNIIAILVAAVIFIIIPRKTISKLRVKFCATTHELSLNELLKEEENHIITRMRRLGNLFYQIHDIYNNMLIGNLDDKQIVEAIKRGIINKNCMNCVKRQTCYDGGLFAEKAVEDFVKLGVNKGRVGVIDVPDFLASRCGKANYIMHSINAYLEEYRKYKSEIKKEDESKLIVSNQLLGVSEILNSFTLNSLFGVRAKKEREQALLDELLYNDIIVKECAIFEENLVFKRGILIVKNKGYKKSEFLNALSGFFKFKVDIIENKFTMAPGYKMVTIVKASKYDYTFGASKASPKLKSGDLYSKLELDENKVMISISDGKGVGEKANRISEMALSLIENFYKAGYNSNIIMDNVNEVMAFKSGENFSAIDVAVLNKNDGSVDFIKRGGTPSVIKSEGSVKVIESDSLPVGMVEGSKTKGVKEYLSSGDVVVLASDGVYDAFNDINSFAGFINNYNSVNMQQLADAILNKAIGLYGGKVQDDMTVVCFRVILNR